MRCTARLANNVTNNTSHPSHQDYQLQRNNYTNLIWLTKRRHWTDWLEEVDDTSIWSINHSFQAPPVGCIYASNPQFKSNILQFYFISFKSITKTSKQPRNIFSIFSVFLRTFILVLFWFLHAIDCMKVCVFAPASRFDSELRKHLPARWLHLTIWPPNGQGAKGPGKQVFASETHLHISSLLSVYTHWGGEHHCHCTIYLFISFVIH